MAKKKKVVAAPGKNYKATLVKGATYSMGPGLKYWKGKSVIVGEKLAMEMKSNGHFSVIEMPSAKEAGAASKKAQKAEDSKFKKSKAKK